MLRLSINEMTTFRWTFEEDVQHYLAAGVRAMGVWRQKLSDYGEEKGAELLHESGIAVSSLSWAGGFTGSDGRSHKESIEDAREAIRLAALLKAECLVVYTGGRAGHTHNHARRLLKGAFQSLLPLAHELGVTLAVEPMHAACAGEWTFLTCLNETLAWMDSLEQPGVKIVFDTYHLGHDCQTLECLERIAPRVAIVQLGDARCPPHDEQNRCRLGEGTLPLGPIVKSLCDSGYTGFFDVKLLGEEIEAADYAELIQQSKHVVAGWSK